MTICSERPCQATANLWSISNKNSTPPFYKDFTICNEHLKTGRRLWDVYEALVAGRFDKQYGESVTHGEWTLKKQSATWKKPSSAEKGPLDHECSCIDRIYNKMVKCKQTERMWGVCELEFDSDGYSSPRTLYQCDLHLSRERYPGALLSPAPRGGNAGIFPLEPTWQVQEVLYGEPPKKKRG